MIWGHSTSQPSYMETFWWSCTSTIFVACSHQILLVVGACVPLYPMFDDQRWSILHPTNNYEYKFIEHHSAIYFPVPRIPTRLQRSWGSPPLVAPAVGGENIYAHWDGSEKTFKAKHIGVQWISCFLVRNRDPIARKARDVFIRIQLGYLKI